MPQLDLAPPLRAAPEGPAGGAAAERVGLHRDVDGASATLQAAWPQPHLTSPTSSRRASAASSAASTRAASRPRRPRTSRTRATTSGGCSTTAASRRGSTTRRSSSTLLELGYGVTNAAYRTTPGSGDLRRGDFDAARLERLARELRPRAIAFVGKEAYRGAFGERAELGPQLRTLGTTGLFVLPSTSPANAAVPYAERLGWFRALHEWLDVRSGAAVRALVLDPADACCSCDS